MDAYQNASFQLEQYEYLSDAKDGAHVSCKWTDRYSDGSEETHDVIWVLRREGTGWRVAGMIIRPFPDKPPVSLNYEDMKALAEAKEFIEQESQRREKAQQQQPPAGQPLTAQQQSPTQQGGTHQPWRLCRPLASFRRGCSKRGCSSRARNRDRSQPVCNRWAYNRREAIGRSAAIRRASEPAGANGAEACSEQLSAKVSSGGRVRSAFRTGSSSAAALRD